MKPKLCHPKPSWKRRSIVKQAFLRGLTLKKDATLYLRVYCTRIGTVTSPQAARAGF